MSDQLDFLLDRYLSTRVRRAGRQSSGPLRGLDSQLPAAQQAMLQAFLKGPIRLPLPPEEPQEQGGIAARNGNATLPVELLRELDDHERASDPNRD